MGANNTSPGAAGIRREMPPPSPGGLPNSQSQYIRQYMAERALAASMDEGQAIHYNIGDGRARTTSSASSYGFESNKLPAVVKWPESGKEIYVSGSWDNWKEKTLLHRSTNESYTILELAEGEHQYKFLVDGQWKHNPNEPTAMNDAGSLNNVVRVRRADFEVMEALDMDDKAKQQADLQRAGNTSIASKEWCQEVPLRSEKRHTPPMLPPALLQVILNRETPVNAEPTLLPEPNHVMLNHLYALSIKDGVMVLSNTHRYRKKYVTTLLYKPI